MTLSRRQSTYGIKILIILITVLNLTSTCSYGDTAENQGRPGQAHQALDNNHLADSIPNSSISDESSSANPGQVIEQLPYEPLFGLESEHRYYLHDLLLLGWIPILLNHIVLSATGHTLFNPNYWNAVDWWMGTLIGTPFSVFVTGLPYWWFLKGLETIPAMKEKFRTAGGGKVQSQDSDYYLVVSADLNVAEIKSQPATLDKINKNRNFINRILFKYPRFLGIHPALVGGSNHIHIDKKTAFARDPLLLRNFIVDFANHSEIALGALAYDPIGPAHVIEGRIKKKLADIIGRFDSGSIKSYGDLVYALGNIFGTRENGIKFNSYYDTIEIRANRSAKNIKKLLLILSLYQKRLEYLRSVKTAIPLLDSNSITSRREGVSQFYLYVTESGLNWGEYKELLPLTWRYIKPNPQKAFQERAGLSHIIKSIRFRCDLFLSNFWLGI